MSACHYCRRNPDRESAELGLEGITTGYERRFDWPAVAAPVRPYLLASVPRTGSTYLAHILWETGCLGAPLEYLNFEKHGPYGAASDSRDRQNAIWDHVLTHRRSANGVFGLKAFPLQMEVLGRHNPRLLSAAMRRLLGAGAASKVVQLRRRDIAAHAISLARASLSGVWRAEQEQQGASEPEYSPHRIERARRELAAQEAAWKQMYRETGITPLVLWYEDVVEDPDAAIKAVAHYLEVELDPSERLTVPKIRQQAQGAAREWRTRHACGNAFK